jgi:enterochelin esterase-like enzyme
VHLSRRSVLLGATGGVVAAGTAGTLVEYDVLPGRAPAHRLLGLTGEAGVIPGVVPGKRAEGVLSSELLAEDPHFVVTYPPGVRQGTSLPVVVALHGAGRTAEAWFDELGIDEFLAASTHRFAIAAVDGGLRSFWHERTDGTDPARMVLEEFVPALEERGLHLSGLLGWSMGGLGALALGARLARSGTEVPVVAVSPALWPEYGQAMPSAFDTVEQYDDVMALVRDELADGEVRIDCGTADPFYRDVRRVVPDDVEQHYEQGAHEAAYWTRVLPAELDWLAGRI